MSKLGETYVDIVAKKDKYEKDLKSLSKKTSQEAGKMGRAFSTRFGSSIKAMSGKILTSFQKIGKYATRFIAGAAVAGFVSLTAAMKKALTMSARQEDIFRKLQTQSYESGNIRNNNNRFIYPGSFQCLRFRTNKKAQRLQIH